MKCGASDYGKIYHPVGEFVVEINVLKLHHFLFQYRGLVRSIYYFDYLYSRL